MNKFVLFACIVSCAHLSSGRPDVSLGYRYHPTQGSSGAGFLQTPTASNSHYFNAAPAFGQISHVGGSGSDSGSAGGFGGGSVGGFGGGSVGGFGGGSVGGFDGGSAGSFGGGSAGGFSGSSGFSGINGFGGNVGFSGSPSFGGSSQYGSSTAGTGSNYNEHVNVAQLAPIVTKHFYLHTAPEDHDEQHIVRHLNIGRPQKNYRVVFINTPSSSLGKAKIIANVAPVEDKTAIYVLSKKSNALDLSAEVVTQAPVNHKPDVFFIKYRTPEEAAHAQHTIQAQYDALGGSSDFVNEGQIPVSSAIGSQGDAGGGDSSNIDQTATIAGTGDNTQQTYLPANHK